MIERCGVLKLPWVNRVEQEYPVLNRISGKRDYAAAFEQRLVERERFTEYVVKDGGVLGEDAFVKTKLSRFDLQDDCPVGEPVVLRSDH
jgi:hypothetical protein